MSQDADHVEDSEDTPGIDHRKAPVRRSQMQEHPFYQALSKLRREERVFVRALLQGTDPEEAAKSAFSTKGKDSTPGYDNRDSLGFYLGKPEVRDAIKAGISRVSDVRVAYQLLSYLSLHTALDIIENGTNQEKITLIRDIWDRAGYVAVHKSESKRLDVKTILSDIQARRLKAVP